ncbi:hypothetical protein PFISCL1PPCAC_9737 [Pristionchus fissidentatus]|uniref:C2H2-type domain-containing protein n=1 Tax=Pristionchus fissidentatus TaxID=1538716 RepID=A0AAV5VG78_9BILA|nr:hypothetical protein PFISCL1PPCAC_9737 [Pristionchus fissidentatus]
MKSIVLIGLVFLTTLFMMSEARGMLRTTSPEIQCREGCANCFAFETCMRNHIYAAHTRYEDPHAVLEEGRKDCHDICDRRFLFFVY